MPPAASKPRRSRGPVGQRTTRQSRAFTGSPGGTGSRRRRHQTRRRRRCSAAMRGGAAPPGCAGVTMQSAAMRGSGAHDCTGVRTLREAVLDQLGTAGIALGCGCRAVTNWSRSTSSSPVIGDNPLRFALGIVDEPRRHLQDVMFPGRRHRYWGRTKPGSRRYCRRW